jgi:hypothetical protein
MRCCHACSFGRLDGGLSRTRHGRKDSGTDCGGSVTSTYSCYRRYEPVTLACYGQYEPWFFRVVSECPPDLADGGVNAVLGIEENLISPEPVDDLLSADNLPISFGQ